MKCFGNNLSRRNFVTVGALGGLTFGRFAADAQCLRRPETL